MAMNLLRLPPAIRTAVAARYLSSPRQVFVNPSCQHASALWSQTCRHDISPVPLGIRKYATIESDQSDQWRNERQQLEYGNDLKDYENLNSANAQHRELEQEGAATTQVSLESEKERLLRVLHKRLKIGKSLRRRNLRKAIKDALAGDNEVLALTELVNRRESRPKREDRSKPATELQADSSPNPPAKADFEGHQIVDLKYIQNTQPLPTKAEYPRANQHLFSPTAVESAVNNACAKLKLSSKAETVFEMQIIQRRHPLSRQMPPGFNSLHTCNLTVDIPEICHTSADGQGTNKGAAKHAAWLHVLSKLHVDGALKELFPDPTPESGEAAVEEEVEDPAMVPTEVDQQTMHEEKDAKVEIYNYAAALGLTPVFETHVVQPRPPRTRLGRIPKETRPVFQVSIKLEEQQISVMTAGKDLKTAETAAALAFKEAAEKQHVAQDDLSQTPVRTEFAVLNVDTAKEFFEFCRNSRSGFNVEMEHESSSLRGIVQQSATLAIGGKPAGHTVTMSTRKKAESIAYLTAAVEIAAADTDLLADFVREFKKGNGKVLRPVNSIDLRVEHEALQSMRDALVEARAAGLPDFRQTLTAEISDDNERSHRSAKRLSPQELSAANWRLLARQRRFGAFSETKAMRSSRAALPMTSYRDAILAMVSRNVYCIVTAGTGSGKTTQVPQILFEDAILDGKGATCNIVCTQPRRIAATSVAQRVAEERNERLRNTVGYQVRFDAQLPYDPYGITYCTTGVLLEKLKHNPDEVLDATTHLLIDEVHERDLNIDFLMIVLKRAIASRQREGKPVPKVILMSATLDAELFSKYFTQTDELGHANPCPSLSVPGRTYPVTESYLGSIMYDLHAKHKSELDTLLDRHPQSREYLESETAFSASAASSLGAEQSAIDWKRERRTASDMDTSPSTTREKEEAIVPIALLVSTIGQICTTSDDGAILVFLPGIEEILTTQNMLRERAVFGLDFNDESRFKIHLLHSSVPKEEQNQIFDPSPPGCRKIILSTNIAETSVTVPDVKYVVDTGKAREKRYDQMRRITKLQCVWGSKSNAKQRAGRAGRVQDGYYYALFSKERHDSLKAVGLPELLRSDLQETCLSITSQQFNEPIASFLSQAIEPPSRQAVDVATSSLKSIEAYTAEEELTALGRVLSQLPVHPALGKMIVLGIIFKCLDPMIILGAAAEERSLFVLPLGRRNEAKRAHHSYAGDSRSDQIAKVNAFAELRSLRDQYGTSAAFDRARERYLHFGAFGQISRTAKQIEEILRDTGLIPQGELERSLYGSSRLNTNANDLNLIKCLLIAGSSQNLAAKTTNNGVLHRTSREQGVMNHPHSLNAELNKGEKQPSGTLSTYGTLARSNDGNTLYLRDTSLVSPLMVVLFGGELEMPKDGRLEMDGWLPFFVKSHNSQYATRLVLEFRKALDRVLNSAFSSLSELDAHSRNGFANDPIIERFADRVVELLNHGAFGQLVQAAWTKSVQRRG